LRCGKLQKAASKVVSRMSSPKPYTLSSKVVRKAESFLSQSCKVMARLIVVHGPCQLANREFHPFHALTTAIISQQLSSKAADMIKHRVLELVPTFCPSGFLAVPIEVLREAGLSSAKAKYIIELSMQVSDGRLNFDALRYMSDDDIITRLTKLSGVGRWTAEMFLIFGLKRPDVLALGDAGLHRAARLLYGDTTVLESIGQAWKPYCSVASWYLWRHLDSDAAT